MASSSSNTMAGSSSARKAKGNGKMDWTTNDGMLRYGLKYIQELFGRASQSPLIEDAPAIFNAAFSDILVQLGCKEADYNKLNCQWRESWREDKVCAPWQAILSPHQTAGQLAADAEARRRIDQAAADLEYGPPDNDSNDDGSSDDDSDGDIEVPLGHFKTREERNAAVAAVRQRIENGKGMIIDAPALGHLPVQTEEEEEEEEEQMLYN